MPILSRAFHQISFLGGEIFNNIKNKFCVVNYATSELSATTTHWKRENQESNCFNKQSKNSDHAAQFLDIFFTSVDWNSNVIRALIPKIFASSTAIVATLISLEIPNIEAQQSKCSTISRQNKILTDL